MPRRFLKRILPDHRRLRELWFMRPFAALLRHPEYWAVRRESVARAFAIGLFVAFIPFPPHSALAPLAALALRANIAVAFATIWITNPFTIVPLFFCAYLIGTVILGVPMSRFTFELSWDWVARELPQVWKPLLAGSLVMSTVSAALGYFGVHWLWRRGVLYRYHRRRRALERRNPANVEKGLPGEREPHFPPRTARRAWLIGALALVIWLGVLGARPLFRPDEGRYAEIPREMLASGDYLVPRLNGFVYVEKPPLQYWVTAAAYRVFGVHPWAARLAPGLAAVLCLLLVGWGAERLWGAGKGLIASVVCASAPLYFLLGQLLTLDMMFTLFLTAALVTFCIGQSVRDEQRRNLRWMLLCWTSIAGAVMTKGIAALAIPAAVLVVYSLWQRDTRLWRASRIGLGLGVCAVLAAPWFIVMSRTVPGFARFFFIHEHLQRYTTLSANRVEPWWFFLPILIIGVLPWAPQIASAWRNRQLDAVPRGSFDARRLLWIWSAVVLLFFSASRSKLIPYVLPVVPVLALLIAGSRSSSSARNAKISAYLALATAALLALGLIGFTLTARLEKQRVLADLITPGLIAMIAVLATAAVAALWLLRRQRVESALASVAGGWFAGGALLIGWAAAAAGPLYSAAPMAAVLASRVPAPSHVYSVSYYEQTLPFYLGRRVDVVNYTGELDFGMRLDPARAISNDDFMARWRNDPDACAVMLLEDYNRFVAAGLPMTMLLKDPRYVLVGRR